MKNSIDISMWPWLRRWSFAVIAKSLRYPFIKPPTDRRIPAVESYECVLIKKLRKPCYHRMVEYQRFCPNKSHMGVSIVMGVPKMIQNGWFLLGKIPSRNGWWRLGYPYDSGNLHMWLCENPAVCCASADVLEFTPRILRPKDLG